jgi:undecaprenyl-diphosphatase
MTHLQAFLMGLLQGLTEFLPVSSSGHLELMKAIFGIHSEKSMVFTVVVHGATVLSIIVVFWKDIWHLIKAFFRFRWDDDMKYIAKLLLSAVPAGIVGLLFEKQLEEFFTGNVLFVGLMLWVTTIFLVLTIWAKDRQRPINFWDSLIIGLAQAVAVIPGISRSGATISTGLLLGNKKDEVAKFSFLMVIIPVIGANFMEIMQNHGNLQAASNISFGALAIGFVTAFVSGVLACKYMIHLVRKSKISYFAIYTFIIGLIAVIYGVTH